MRVCVCVLIRCCVIVFGSFPTWISDPHRLVHHYGIQRIGYIVFRILQTSSRHDIIDIYSQDLAPPPTQKTKNSAPMFPLCLSQASSRLKTSSPRSPNSCSGHRRSGRSIPTSSDSPATATKMRQDFRHFNDPVEMAYVRYVQFHHVSSCFFRMSWVWSWDLNSTIYRYRSSLNNN